MKEYMQIKNKLSYLVSGFTGKVGRRAECPACASVASARIDRKYFHELLECKNCGLLFRFPQDSAERTKLHYEHDYNEPGLTTELPSEDELRLLLSTEFKGSEKDFSYHARVLHAIGVKAGMRLLDYGANWGYTSWQFGRLGLVTSSFEISSKRAAFGSKLGLNICTDLREVGEGFDAVYSSHVLEHTSNPRTVVEQQLALLKPGGLAIAHTPNGSSPRRRSAPNSLHSVWGQVHPVLLTDRFVAYLAGSNPYFVSSNDSPEAVGAWDKASQLSGDVSGPGLFFAIRKGRV